MELIQLPSCLSTVTLALCLMWALSAFFSFGYLKPILAMILLNLTRFFMVKAAKAKSCTKGRGCEISRLDDGRAVKF